ncbi:NAD(P)H-dependent oxidoreductase [Kitasatospora sp. NPDC059463]|uniref:NAD(P)H-dependent oxidoreductase n=1 Tax=unclassified Kitasatospora TaxID=2633591 RepID=UPI0036B0837D
MTTDDTRTLVLLAHPDLAASRVNAALARAARSVPSVTVHDLYAAYPRSRRADAPATPVDAGFEQKLLAAHDHVVFQFPLQWYSSPPLLKEWLDEVLTEGFAYGPGGEALRGRSLRVATSTGGPAAAYRPGGRAHRALPDLLLPYAATANLVGMDYRPPFAVQDARALSDPELAGHADRYRELLAAG